MAKNFSSHKSLQKKYPSLKIGIGAEMVPLHFAHFIRASGPSKAYACLWERILCKTIITLSTLTFLNILGFNDRVNIPSKIKNEYVRTGNSVANKLHIIVGEDIILEKGDTIVLSSRKASQIEIKRKKPAFAPGFVPHYAL